MRFLGHDPFEQNLRVIIKDPGDLQVDFLKLLGDKERKNSRIICQVPIIPRSPVQVFTILLFKCIHLHFNSSIKNMGMSKNQCTNVVNRHAQTKFIILPKIR